MTEGARQEAPATFADPLADFLAEAIAKMDALLEGLRVEEETPPRAEVKALIGEVSSDDAAFEPRAAA